MRVNIYIRKEDEEAWENIDDIPGWIHEGLTTGLVMIPAKRMKEQELMNAIEDAHVASKNTPPVITGESGSVVGVLVHDILPIKDAFLKKLDRDVGKKPLNTETKDYSLCKHDQVKGFCKKGCK